jgi:tetratricopeptide (TPR) repeat protein
MVLEHAPGRYTLHDLLRAYATQLAGSIDSAEHRHDATARVLDHYLHTAHTGDGLLLAHPTRTRITLPPARASVTVEEFADHQQALDWFTAEHAVLLAALDHAAATGFDTHACQMNSSIAVFLYRRGHWHDRLATGKTAMAAAVRLADPLVEADAQFGLADAYLRFGEYDEAHDRLSRALQLYAGAGDLAGQAHIQHGFCYLWDLREQPARALDHARQALDLYQAAGHRAGQANILSKLGWQHSRLGDHQQALDYCRQALPLQQELRNHTGEAHAWGNLGYAHHHLGNHTEAISCHRRAAGLFHDLGDRYNEALNLANLGDAHQGAGDDHSSRDAYLRALTILTDLDSPDADKIRAKLAGSPTT